ncbi:gametocyte-specific factor 1 homolog [Drosophila hydei]|uniref:Gametocyte-specific factor 1 homolog n=1 Tax=Drosophila hydei TaxID=7224 RepID=A0A6J1LAD9_DROHY|nr:gametocyte-specific factor 1 homolog [Drosophila hydei]
MASSSSFNDFVTCPYNKGHVVLRGRLTKHLVRCSRNSDTTNKLLLCPFNANHRFNAEQLKAHIKVCPERASLERYADKEQLPSVGESASIDLVECEEDWDKEPDAPTYNPSVYCEENLVIRSSCLNGQSKAARRDFRASERRRFAEKR